MPSGFSPSAVCVALAAPVLVAGLALWPRDGRAVAVYAGQDPSATVAAIARAGGDLVAPAALRGFIIAKSDEPDFARRLIAEGALLVLDAIGAGGCTGRPISKSTRTSSP